MDNSYLLQHEETRSSSLTKIKHQSHRLCRSVLASLLNSTTAHPTLTLAADHFSLLHIVVAIILSPGSSVASKNRLTMPFIYIKQPLCGAPHDKDVPGKNIAFVRSDNRLHRPMPGFLYGSFFEIRNSSSSHITNSSIQFKGLDTRLTHIDHG
jgi:hypothetical protein